MSIKFPKGTTITCPGCGKHIGVSNREIHCGENMSTADWDSDIIQRFERMTCPDDGLYYFDAGKVHTLRGWL